MRCGRGCSPACSRSWPLVLAGQPGSRADPGARAARGRGRPVRAAVERRVPGRHADAVAAGRPGLGRVAGGLRGAAADLPGRRLAHAERGRPGAVRPHQRRLRGVSRGATRGNGRRGAGHGRADGPQHAVQPGLGPAGAVGAGLRHRRRPGRRARARRPGRPRPLLPALAVGPVRGGAGPLPADRGGPGHHRICRTVLGARRGGRRTRPHRGRTPGRRDAPGHRARLGHQAAAPAAHPGQRPRLPGRPARRRLHPAAGPGGAHRPDRHRARLAGPAASARPTRSARRSPAPTGAVSDLRRSSR